MALINSVLKKKNVENYIEEYDELIKKYQPVDLGMGYPDYLPSNFVSDALKEVVTTASAEDHQYTDPKGHPRLRRIISKIYSIYLKRQLDTENEIIITAGSSEALFCSILGLISPGDEVIVIEPCFMVFVSLIKMAGGVPKFLSLEYERSAGIQTSANWALNKEKLERLFSDKTSAIILNTPHNPTGKVFGIEELSIIADLCKKWDTICIADEVYERMVFDPKIHIRIASLPGMFERTVTIGAAEKSFGVTGWQIGWIYGGSELLKPVKVLHQHIVFNASTPLQIAFALMLEREYNVLDESSSYFREVEADLRAKRDFLVEKLEKTRIKPIVPEGGMFILGDIRNIASSVDLSSENDQYLDLKFVKWLTKEYKLQAFPVTVFCSDPNKKFFENLVRFCFVKKQDTLNKASEILTNL